jgi:dipeptidyl aminopeptidase/acylaminoacyl peptidase
VQDARFSPDGKHIVTAARSNTWLVDTYEPQDAGIRIWDAETGRQMAHIPANVQEQGALAFSPDGKRFAVTVEPAQVKVFSLEPLRERVTLSGHRDQIHALTYSPDGRRLLTGSRDFTAKLWDAATGRELLTLKGHNVNVVNVNFFPDGRRIVTSSWDQTSRFWDIATPEDVARWDRETKAHTTRIEAAATERLTVLTTARTASRAAAEMRKTDPGAIKQWLVLGPCPLQGTDGEEALNLEQIPGEDTLQPRVNQPVRIDEKELPWRPIRQEQYLIDFKRVLPEPHEYCVAYAVTYVISDSAQTNLSLQIRSDDQSKIYLNGEEVFQRTEAGGWKADDRPVNGIELKAGLNTLVFKVVNGTASWMGSVWLTDHAGNPVPGISVTLDPEGKE